MSAIATNTQLYIPKFVGRDRDFTDVKIGDVWLSDLNVYRVSDGSRYGEDLLPTIQDKTAQIPGGDGTYYFGSYYTQRPFNIQIAFDNLTETNFKRLREILSSKKLVPLVFYERPYKVYIGKTSGTSSINYVCFLEKGKRIYKGEGSFQFVCYYPFARCTYGNRSASDYNSYPNKDEWIESSGLKDDTDEKRKNEDFVWNTDKKGYVSTVYNPGDIETSFKLIIPSSFIVPYKNIIISSNKQQDTSSNNNTIIAVNKQMILRMTQTQIDSLNGSLIIDTEKHLIYNSINEVFGNFLKEGDFFKLAMNSQISSPEIITVSGEGIKNVASNEKIIIKYDYLYF